MKPRGPARLSRDRSTLSSVTFRYLDIDVADGAHTIKLNRPERLNALTQDVVSEMIGAFGDVASVENNVVLLRGEGRAFCAGWDLKDAAAAGRKSLERIRSEIETMQELTRVMRNCPLPIIGIIHGYAMGAGCEIALSCDLVIAERSTVFAFPETSVGLSVTGGFTHILPRTVGIVKAKELILLGRRFGASDAHDMGLVNFVCDEDELDGTVEMVVDELRDKAKIALRIAKQQIDLGSQLDLETAMRLEVELGVQASLSQESDE